MFLEYEFPVKKTLGKEGSIKRNKALTFEFPILQIPAERGENEADI